jgi:hypothetical protein
MKKMRHSYSRRVLRVCHSSLDRIMMFVNAAMACRSAP